jgi:pimeloyl-ACP methyl ester carboxylesterase
MLKACADEFCQSQSGETLVMQQDKRTRYKTQQIGKVTVFYREAGAADAPVVLLLHGFPTASHMFRGLIPLLADHYRVIAPDLPGFGQTKAPPRGEFDYSFDRIADVIDGSQRPCRSIVTRFTSSIMAHRSVCGWRSVTPSVFARSSARTAMLISMASATSGGRGRLTGAMRARRTAKPVDRRCRRGRSRTGSMARGPIRSASRPDGYELDIAYMARSGAEDIQLDLIRDYRTNVALYPEFQSYFRAHQPPLAVWGRHDPAFIPAGAEAYKRDLPDAEVHLLDAGHFALETHADDIAALIIASSARVPHRYGGNDSDCSGHRRRDDHD